MNPFKFGMIGSTDAHTALTTVEEENFFGKHSGVEPDPHRFEHVVIEAPAPDLTIVGWKQAAAGYAAVWTNSIGDPELSAVWTDPNFDPDEPAYYYARVIEIPTPRWTAHEAKRFGVTMPSEVPMTTTERAYTSPIWCTPYTRATGGG